MTEVCPKHRRWIRLVNDVSGEETRRDCPECPKKHYKREFLHVRTGRVLRTPI